MFERLIFEKVEKFKMEIEVHELTNDPTAAWEEIKKTQIHTEIPMQPLDPKVPKNKVRIVCMSDTHSTMSHIKFDIPDGDIFIHAGDFTTRGRKQEVIEFNEWIGQLPHKHKVVIAGNHEIPFEKASSKNEYRQYLTKCTYLEDELIEICGLKIFGTPWQPVYGFWAFNVPRGAECLEKWNKIPENIDLLVSHGPPLGHGDLCRSGLRAGCVELLSTVQQRVKPKYHIFGHIHEGYGITSDGTTTFVNASTCNIFYFPQNQPIAFDIELPEGVCKY